MAIQNLSNDTTLAYLFRKVESGMQALKELISGKVSKSGDTMTGVLEVDNSTKIKSIQITDGTVVSASSWGNTLQFLDSNGSIIGLVHPAFWTNGIQAISLTTRRKVSGSSVDNSLDIGIKTDGTKYVQVTDAAPWLTALGLTTTATTTTSSIITPGSGITINSAGYAQYGKIAQIIVSWKSSNTISVDADGNATNVTVGTVVSGKRPKITTAGTSYGDNGGPAFYFIDADGLMQLGACGGTGASRTIAANTLFQALFTYILP